MRVAMIGVGYVGLVSGACFSEFGVDVICVDEDRVKINQLQAGEMRELRREAEERRARATKSDTAEAAPVGGVLDPGAALPPEAGAQQLALFMREAGLAENTSMTEAVVREISNYLLEDKGMKYFLLQYLQTNGFLD